mmetsp:Transcript_20484/g.19459  ORF Transcript_20484/g.19459 Transcript_20484/m.19459 type:complete len:110 (+) Transcript_20484:1287-1616(+)
MHLLIGHLDLHVVDFVHSFIVESQLPFLVLVETHSFDLLVHFEAAVPMEAVLPFIFYPDELILSGQVLPLLVGRQGNRVVPTIVELLQLLMILILADAAFLGHELSVLD